MAQISGEQTSGLSEPVLLCGLWQVRAPILGAAGATLSAAEAGVCRALKGLWAVSPCTPAHLSAGQAEALGCREDYMSAESPCVLTPHHCRIPEAAGTAYCCLVC